MTRRQNGTCDAAGEAFWRFSLALYARPGVAPALIALQDRAGCNVNLILFALWRGATRGERLDAAGLAGAAAVVAPLDAVVVPLRALRRQLKFVPDHDTQALRRGVAGIEIAAERAEQRRLAASLGSPPRGAPETDRRAAAAANLALCLGAADGSAEAGLLRRSLAALMRCA